jgi:6,7-dimethyl-8-ribityllumazine synthase
LNSNRFDADLSAQGLRFAIVVSRFNEAITERLLSGAVNALEARGLDSELEVWRVPGAWEIPLAAAALARGGSFDAIICLGAVIRGDTPHFDYVAGECARGLQNVQIQTGVPMVFGVLTTDNVEQAEERAGGRHGNKGADAALTAIEMARLLRAIRA